MCTGESGWGGGVALAGMSPLRTKISDFMGFSRKFIGFAPPTRVDSCSYEKSLIRITGRGGSRTSPRRGRQSPGGRLPNILILFSEKPYEIKEILVRSGGRPPTPKSATDWHLLLHRSKKDLFQMSWLAGEYWRTQGGVRDAPPSRPNFFMQF